jgi:hypothetical protein
MSLGIAVEEGGNCGVFDGHLPVKNTTITPLPRRISKTQIYSSSGIVVEEKTPFNYTCKKLDSR